jgi:hypothetical protein
MPANLLATFLGQRMKVSIGTNGIKQWMRFFIVDSDDNFWTGKEWSPNRRDALLFHKASEAREEQTKAQQMLPDDDQSWE